MVCKKLLNEVKNDVRERRKKKGNEKKEEEEETDAIRVRLLIWQKLQVCHRAQ